MDYWVTGSVGPIAFKDKKINSQKANVTYEDSAVIIQRHSIDCDIFTALTFKIPCNPYPPQRKELNSLEALEKFRLFLLLQKPTLADINSLGNAPTQEVMDRDMKQPLIPTSPKKPTQRCC